MSKKEKVSLAILIAVALVLAALAAYHANPDWRMGVM